MLKVRRKENESRRESAGEIERKKSMCAHVCFQHARVWLTLCVDVSALFCLILCNPV